MVLLVYKTSALKKRDEVVKVTVNIPDGDHGFRRHRWNLRLASPRESRRHQD
jgi:hypothetical protein